MLRAQDLSGYFRVPSDNRDLNYDAYFIEGKEKLSEQVDYNSNNTRRLTEDELVALLLKLDYVQEELKTWRKRQGETV